MHWRADDNSNTYDLLNNNNKWVSECLSDLINRERVTLAYIIILNVYI